MYSNLRIAAQAICLPALPLAFIRSPTRFIIVLAILGQAIGLQQSPSHPVLVDIALCLTLLVMCPVWQEMYTEAYVPFEADQISLKQGLGEGKRIISQFMLAQTSKNSLETLVALAGEEMPEDLAQLDFSLLPAFVLSERKTAVQLGFMIFVPFLAKCWPSGFGNR